jgi:archaellum component FlaC
MTKKPASQTLRIAPQSHKPTLSKAQQAFNNLVAKIEARRAQLVQWQAVVQLCQQKVASDYLPVMQAFKKCQADMVRGLDQVLDQKGLTKVEREAVQGIICSLAERLVADTGDESLKAIYNKYSEDDFDSEAAYELEDMKQSMEDMFGVDLGDTSDVTSPEELLAKIHAQMAQEASQAEASPPPKRKKTAKQLAREAEKKAEDDQTSLSIREVYRKLVSALHPDREPDPDERQRKTALMQRVNQAYDKKDLLQLLELQLELEHIDAHSIAGMSEDRIKHFNKILKEQLAELDQEIEYVEMPLRAQFNAYSFQTLTPASVIPQLNSDIADLKRQVNEIKQDLSMLKDLPSLKAWIKAYRRQVKAMQRDQDDDFFF